jgi:hypothetical protein
MDGKATLSTPVNIKIIGIKPKIISMKRYTIRSRTPIFRIFAAMAITIIAPKQIVGITKLMDHPIHPMDQSHRTERILITTTCQTIVLGMLFFLRIINNKLIHIQAIPDATISDHLESFVKIKLIAKLIIIAAMDINIITRIKMLNS